MDVKWEKEVVLITGASSGLGRALSRKVAEKKASIIMVGRNSANLEKSGTEVSAAGGRPYLFPFDLHDTLKVAEFYKELISRIGKTPSILINNAGYNAAGFVQNTPVEVYERNFKVNVFAPVALIQCVLPDMLANQRGVIVDIVGAANYHSFPGASSYCATKVALGAIHESLQTELADLSVRTLKVNPGSFRSNYGKNRLVQGRLKDYQYPVHSGGKDPEFVALKIIQAIEQKKSELNLSSGMDRIGHHLAYWAPKLVDKLLVMRNGELLKHRP